MTKFFGKIGYAIDVETTPGVWTEEITEREYFGDMTKRSSRIQGSDNVNDTVILQHTISILSDPFALDHYSQIRYIRFDDTNAKWKIESVEVAFPRLNLVTGGLYNG